MEVRGINDYSLITDELNVSIKKAEKKNLKPHIAKVLEEHGIIEITPITNVYLKKKIMEEKNQSKLTEIPEDFYSLVRLSAEKHGATDKKGSYLILSLVTELFKIRLEKIFKYALQSKKPKFSLQAEEKIFYTRILSLYNSLENSVNERKADDRGL